MPGINGINAAREIRQYDTAVQIIFVTSSSEFAVQSYVVGAYYYQLKPIWKDSFSALPMPCWPSAANAPSTA